MKYEYLTDKFGVNKRKLIPEGKDRKARPVYVISINTLLDMGRLNLLTGTALEDYRREAWKD